MMTRDFTASPGGGEWYLEWPFKVAYVGLGLTLASLPLSYAAGNLMICLCILFMLAGLLCAGFAVWVRMSHPGEDDFEERSKTGVLVALASGSALGAMMTLRHWDSLQLWMMVLWCLTFAAVPLLMLPRLARRALISLAIVYHFGGMVTAATAVPLSTSPSPWLPTLIWNNVYRNYLTFMYLNNAYHFYSPEPGPPSLVWFLVEFDKGEPHWIRIPRREEYTTRQQYQRMLSLTESVNSYQPVSFKKREALAKRRGSAGELFRDPKTKEPRVVPLHPYIDWNSQFLEPSEQAKKYLQSYAEYVCRTAKSKSEPDAKAKSVKVYRLTHRLISAPELVVTKLSPTDPVFFTAYFFGEYEYTPDGKEKVRLKENRMGDRDEDLSWMEPNANGTVVKMTEKYRDPFLYWLLPIWRDPKPGKENSLDPNDYILYDALSAHAGVAIKWEMD